MLVPFPAEVCGKVISAGQVRSLEDRCLEDVVRADGAACHGVGVELHHDIAVRVEADDAAGAAGLLEHGLHDVARGLG